MGTKPFRDEFIDQGQGIARDQVFGDTAKEPCCSGKNDGANSEMKPKQALWRQPRLDERKRPGKTVLQEALDLGGNHVSSLNHRQGL